MIREFRLSPPARGGVSCDTDGAFVGRVSLLQRSHAYGDQRWGPRDCEQLSNEIGLEFGLPIDVSRKTGGLKAICNALNEGDVARAQIATVLLGIPGPPDLTKSFRSESEMITFIRDLHWSGLIKRDWDPDFHPRWPAGAPESQGGEFAPIWEAIGNVVGAIGSEQTLEANTNPAAGRAGAEAIGGALKDYANYRAQPWIGRDGLPARVWDIDLTGDPRADRAALWGHELAEPNAPLTRPATNADWIDPIVGAASAASMAVGPTLGLIGEGTTAAADSAIVAADTPFIILPSELPADFDITLPIGRYAIPPNAVPGTTTYGNLVGAQIGRLVQDRFPNLVMILRTSPGMRGGDIELQFGDADLTGFQYGEIKPLTDYGYRSFNTQVARWKLDGPVHVFTYDYQGNIYYGFPW